MIRMDYFTIVAGAQLAYLGLALSMFLVVRRRRDTDASLIRWAQGLMLAAAATFPAIAFNLYDQMIPAAVTGFVQILGFGLLLDAVTRLGGRPAPNTAVLLPPIALACAQLLQTEDPDSRRMLYYLVASGQFVACTALALSASREIPLRSRLLLAGSFLVGVVGFVWRAIDLTGLALAFSANAQQSSGSSLGALLNFVSLLWASTMLLQIHFERSSAAGTRLSTLDPQTGAYNRRTFIRLGQREIARAQRRGQRLSVLHLRLDEASLPREPGAAERAIARVSKTLTESLARQDVAGRLDEGEFAAILPEAGLKDALGLAERLRLRIADMPDIETGKVCSVSIGVAERADNELQPGLVLARAEAAVMQARASGGNRVEAARSGGLGRAAISNPG